MNNKQTQQPISKVRSHSSEVYDISFSTTNSNTLLTCGEDGSLRIFDLRSINQFSVLYKTMNQPILRASWNEQNNSTIGFIQKDDQDVYLIDIRYDFLIVFFNLEILLHLYHYILIQRITSEKLFPLVCKGSAYGTRNSSYNSHILSS